MEMEMEIWPEEVDVTANFFLLSSYNSSIGNINIINRT